MQQLTEAKFPRTGKEYKLEKTETGFNLRLIDLSKKIEPELFSFQELLELSESKQITFTGFEEKNNEAELILLNCIHETAIANCKEENEKLVSNNEKLTSENEAIQKENEELKAENETLKNIITGLKEVKDLAGSE